MLWSRCIKLICVTFVNGFVCSLYMYGRGFQTMGRDPNLGHHGIKFGSRAFLWPKIKNKNLYQCKQTTAKPFLIKCLGFGIQYFIKTILKIHKTCCCKRKIWDDKTVKSTFKKKKNHENADLWCAVSKIRFWGWNFGRQRKSLKTPDVWVCHFTI